MRRGLETGVDSIKQDIQETFHRIDRAVSTVNQKFSGKTLTEAFVKVEVAQGAWVFFRARVRAGSVLFFCFFPLFESLFGRNY
jgi:hypothetical protein